MTGMTIPDEVFRQIAQHGERSYPEECCGVMLGKETGSDRIVHEVIEIDNTQESNRQRRFLITSAQYRKAEQQAAERQLDLLGFYHSHPDHPAAPSAFDTEHALPWFTYVIVSIVKGKADRATAWVLEESRARFAEQSLHVESGHPLRVSALK
jgi:proteasome lid subunit RPN8/RPN11